MLHDDYTARAAAVIRVARRRRRPHRRQRRRPRPRGCACTHGRRHRRVRASLGRVLLAHGRAAARRARRSPATRPANERRRRRRPTRAPAAAAAAKAQPKSYDARIATPARAPDADATYLDAIAGVRIAAAQLDPTQPEPLAYTGWISGACSPRRRRTRRPQQRAARRRRSSSLDQAIAVDPDVPRRVRLQGSRCYMNVAGQARAAPCPRSNSSSCSRPQDHPMRQQVLDALARRREVELDRPPTT